MTLSTLQIVSSSTSRGQTSSTTRGSSVEVTTLLYSFSSSRQAVGGGTYTQSLNTTKTELKFFQHTVPNPTKILIIEKTLKSTTLYSLSGRKCIISEYLKV